MKNKVKILSIVLSGLGLLVVALVAGLGLAIWDSGSSVSEVYSLMFPEREIIVGETVVIDPSGHFATDDKQDEDKESSDGKKIISIIDELNPDAEDDGDDAQAEEVPAETEEENTEERKPLEITSEISGIGTVARAGAEEDTLANDLPVPTQITENTSNIDPQADYPLPYQEVDLSYFDDALFIGDSRVAGLAMNSGTNATFYAVTSFQLYKYKTFKVVQTPNGKVPIFDVMPYDKFTKIYIKVGLNELGSVTDEPFLEAYTNLINDLRAMQPRAIIYIQAVLPVTQAKSNTDKVHCNENIRKRNENLKIFAETMKCYYVDVGPYFADETGALRAETTSDGIHMAGKYMPEWIEALRQNAVVWPPQ